MKKEIKKAMTIEDLAIITQNGFIGIEQRMMGELKREISSVKEEMNARFSEVDARFNEVDAHFDIVDSRLTNLTLEQQETNRRLDTIERHQRGMLQSIDETVPRNEFVRLEKRVEALEN
ncbi:MAG: hypothetical protein NT098_00990 [Candidatus Parcubacteria bacterium]|nr:hypothetical protein [Candidatus Parcubacteria bacterium]